VGILAAGLLVGTAYGFSPSVPPQQQPPVVISSPEDSNGAPHLSGVNTNDADRVTFGNVLERPVFIMSNTEIFVLNGKAIADKVPVFFDGVQIGEIKTRAPSMIGHDQWTGIGGEIVQIPFEVYYKVTDDGKLLTHDNGLITVPEALQHLF